MLRQLELTDTKGKTIMPRHIKLRFTCYDLCLYLDLNPWRGDW